MHLNIINQQLVVASLSLLIICLKGQLSLLIALWHFHSSVLTTAHYSVVVMMFIHD